MRNTTARVALAVAAIGSCAAITSLALAQEQTQQQTDPEQAALERFCAGHHPCVVVNGAADAQSGDDQPHLVTLGQALAASGKPASACPDARDAYAEAGIDADAFVGPCPKDPPASSGPLVAEAARANTEAALQAEGGSR